ncbi:MAG TPA: universal stress protein [Candidatus Binatia bacterium]|jgi:nucleotide-binding universal stress UspA family protein|nr:universal stress protein [Candidatus Binatia bacterium]
MQVKTILVPSDFSDYAEYAFTWALEMAEKWDAKVVVLNAAPMFSHLAYPESVYMVDLAKMEAELIADADKKLREFVAKQGTSTVPVETRAVLGDPFWEICKAAEQEPADLIVMGSHGRTGLAHVLLGSVAERVVRHASCPVLVARLPRPPKK